MLLKKDNITREDFLECADLSPLSLWRLVATFQRSLDYVCELIKAVTSHHASRLKLPKKPKVESVIPVVIFFRMGQAADSL